MKNESDFDAALTKVCALMKCRLIDIPDMIWTGKMPKPRSVSAEYLGGE